MIPVICFYQDRQYFYSEDYQTKLKPKGLSLNLFLKQIEDQYLSELKILQVDFDNQENQSDKISSTRVFILNNFKIISENELVTKKVYNFLFKPDIKKEFFLEKARRIKSDISLGRYYQINLTSSLSSTKNNNKDLEVDSYELFKFYFQKFKAPFSAFLPYDNSQILCYSPELFLKKWGPHIVSQPIKGTLKAQEHVTDLLNNPKETAELSMIVDLLRNDLQSVCEDPVQVTEHKKILKLNYTQHTFSEISGQTNKVLSDILPNVLPGGSISGCPKKESLIAIKELEETSRGFYTGCIGWWRGTDFTLNLAIRSFLNSSESLKYYTGCGIVYDSDPELEWQEFLNKASVLKVLL